MNISNSIMENLLQRHKNQAALVLDALFVADLQLWPYMDFLTISSYLRRSEIFIGDTPLKKGLYDLVQLKLLDVRKIMTRQKGRPRWEYRLKKEAEMAAILGLDLHESENRDSIPFEAFKHVTAYRAAKHYSFLKRLGTSYLSRKKLGARLGVGGRATFNYEKKMTLQVIPRSDERELSLNDLMQAPEKRLAGNTWLEVEFERDMTDAEMMEVYKGFDESILLVGRRKTSDRLKMPYTRYILERELAKGHRVFLMKQITNEYKVA